MCVQRSVGDLLPEKMDSKADNTMYLPRQVVVQLLHAAQSAGGKPVGGVITITNERCWRAHSLPTGPGGLPDLSALQQLMGNCKGRQEKLFACYRTIEDISERPVIPINHLLRNLPQLLIHLGTRGVLGIRGWYPHPDGYQAVAIGMHEAID